MLAPPVTVTAGAEPVSEGLARVGLMPFPGPVGVSEGLAKVGLIPVPGLSQS